ncbi:hypothetical protein Taro_003809, partial [Colocasia esculenta]|nr:hypothetical protein [Colocasia esculenta]
MRNGEEAAAASSNNLTPALLGDLRLAVFSGGPERVRWGKDPALAPLGATRNPTRTRHQAHPGYPALPSTAATPPAAAAGTIPPGNRTMIATATTATAMDQGGMRKAAPAAAGPRLCPPVDAKAAAFPGAGGGGREEGGGGGAAPAPAPPRWMTPPPDDEPSSSSSYSASGSVSPSPSAPGDPSSPSPLLLSEMTEPGDGGSNGRKRMNKCLYRSQLEQEVQKLREQLQEEVDLHIALAHAVAQDTSTLTSSPDCLPEKDKELLANISMLEITVAKLEEELASLHSSLIQERNERYLAEYHLGHSPSLALMPRCCFSDYSWEQHISSLRTSKSSQIPQSLNPDAVIGCEDPPSMTMNSHSQLCREEKESQLCSGEYEGMEMDMHLEEADSIDSLNENFLIRNLWHHPNQLSEEMVWCMRNIFLCLSESSNASSKVSSSECFPSPCSPVGPLSSSSLTSFSDSSVIPPLVRSPLTDMSSCHEAIPRETTFDPYGVHGKVNWPNIGSYNSAVEVSWMVVGKKQLEYAAEALRIFRFLVEQLAKVNPAKMNCNQKLAFWINLYNALIMHVSYTIGGQSISAADIEYVILKMKPPVYRPQIALILALHKFKISEEHKKFSMDDPEPLAVFGISCGMYSSPAVRIFTANKVKEELQSSFRDYVRASVGISDKGKLLVPKLLHCFAKSVVEDSLLVDWICRFLSPEQAAEVRNSTSHRKQRLLGARSFCVVPFDSRFRYLFLPDNKSSRRFLLNKTSNRTLALPAMALIRVDQSDYHDLDISTERIEKFD